MSLIENFVKHLRLEDKSENTICNYRLAVKEYFSWFEGTFDKHPRSLYIQNVKDYLQYLQVIKNEVPKRLTLNFRLFRNIMNF
ncbi:phage integrase N-terminal SAM-like domain-containing protein [Virgibacillus sp. 6R]|uniref:phage integrase N-terminal SAM-like domain-containing protein n=1 Tax=Metabacillus sp. 22489 TaxID=3453928 RepID=UPI002103341B